MVASGASGGMEASSAWSPPCRTNGGVDAADPAGSAVGPDVAGAEGSWEARDVEEGIAPVGGVCSDLGDSMSRLTAATTRTPSAVKFASGPVLARFDERGGGAARSVSSADAERW